MTESVCIKSMEKLGWGLIYFDDLRFEKATEQPVLVGRVIGAEMSPVTMTGSRGDPEPRIVQLQL